MRTSEVTERYSRSATPLRRSRSSGSTCTLNGTRPERFGFWVFRDNARARRFYEYHGAEALYETDGSNNEERAPDVRYEWRPPPSPAEAEA